MDPMKILSRIVATFFGSGFCPIAPGTAASFLTALIYMFFLSGLPGPAQALVIAAVFVAGVPAASRYSTELGQKDPGRIVIDEACGQLIALFMLPPDPVSVASAFFIFRIFDIIKPYPIKKLEGFPRGWGIMADDVGAGLASALVLRLVFVIL
jgi:phosphatidylglycerophosphatase A